VAAYYNDKSPKILAYGWHGDSDALIVPSILVYGGHSGCAEVRFKSSILAYGV
jgi:hypothetical protein